MRNRLLCSLAVLVAALAFSTMARAQAGSRGANGANKETAAIAKEHCLQPGQPGTRYQVLCADTKTPAPAPKHDIMGTWEGPIGAVRGDPIPPMTDLGKKMAAMNHANGAVNVGDSNDPLNHCDPLGFPRNAVFELRGLSIGQMPNRILILSQYERIWREVWTDGRALPTGFGSDKIDAPDPRYYGYSVGHWENDTTFVVETVGADDSSWLDNAGHPHSAELKATERYERVDHDTLKVTVNVDDPKYYTKPFLLGTTVYKWVPDQQIEEQLCIPSQSQLYTDIIANPAAQKK
jgi:hypothetical protein